MNKLKDLKQNLENSIRKVIEVFEEKQDLYFEFFVCDDFTGVACFSNEYYIHFSDIAHDIFTDQPKGMITEWQEASVINENQNINYQSYCIGLRFKDVVQ